MKHLHVALVQSAGYHVSKGNEPEHRGQNEHLAAKAGMLPVRVLVHPPAPERSTCSLHQTLAGNAGF